MDFGLMNILFIYRKIVKFQSPHGEVFTKKFIGMTARIFQHELDHLDGILFFNKANRFHREQAFRKAKL